MNDAFYTKQIESAVCSEARLDFADLLKRIEADGGQSTAPRMKAGSSAGKVIGVAAGIVAVTAVSAVTIVGLSSGMMSSESAAPEAPMDAECLMEDNYFAGDMAADSAPEQEAADQEPTVQEPEWLVSDSDVSDSDVSDSDVSDSDVSDSDVSDSDAGGEGQS